MQNFQDIEHFIKTLSAAIKKKIPTKVSQLTNDAGYKTTDTTYKLSKTGSTVTLTGSDGSTTSVADSNTTYSSLKNPYSLTIQNNGTTVASYDGSTAKTANFTNATASADGLMSKADKAKLDGINSSYATKSELSSHSQNTSNPHKVTASQVGALPLSGGSLTGNLTAPSFQTGTGGANYFQCRKFRGEGDANTYYHAVDFGCAGHNQVDFYEYGGKYVFHRHQQAAQSSGDMVIGEINGNGFVGKVNGHTINADVPAGAKFTDTTYSNATTSVAGLMSPTDKAKLDGISSGADAVTIKTVKVNGTALTPDSNKAVNVTVPTLANNATTTTGGMALDARMGKTLSDQILSVKAGDKPVEIPITKTTNVINGTIVVYRIGHLLQIYAKGLLIKRRTTIVCSISNVDVDADADGFTLGSNVAIWMAFDLAENPPIVSGSGPVLAQPSPIDPNSFDVILFGVSDSSQVYFSLTVPLLDKKEE